MRVIYSFFARLRQVLLTDCLSVFYRQHVDSLDNQPYFLARLELQRNIRQDAQRSACRFVLLGESVDVEHEVVL